MPRPMVNPYTHQEHSFFASVQTNIPIFQKICEKLLQMSKVNDTTNKNLLLATCKPPLEGLYEMEGLLRSIPSEIAKNNKEMLVNPKNLSNFVKMMALAKLELSLDRTIDATSESTFYNTLFYFEESCQTYIKSCRCLYGSIESIYIPKSIYHLREESIQVLIKEIKCFELTISDELKTLLLSQAELESYETEQYTAVKYAKKILFIIFLLLGIVIALIVVRQLRLMTNALNDVYEPSLIERTIIFLYVCYAYKNLEWFYNPLYSLVGSFLGMDLILHPSQILSALHSRNALTILAMFATHLFILVPQANGRLGQIQQNMSRRLRGTTHEPIETVNTEFITQALERLNLKKVAFRTGDPFMDSFVRRVITYAPDVGRYLIGKFTGSEAAPVQRQRQRRLENPPSKYAEQEIAQEFWRLIEKKRIENQSNEELERLGLLNRFHSEMRIIQERAQANERMALARRQADEQMLLARRQAEIEQEKLGRLPEQDWSLLPKPRPRSPSPDGFVLA